MDPRSKEIISDAFRFGIAHPLKLDFGVSEQKIISPKAVGFQFVVGAMATRLRKKNRKDASSIIVDRQAQFNDAQIRTHYNLKRISEAFTKDNSTDKRFYLPHPLFHNLEEDVLLHKGLPRRSITVSSSADSIGLQIVDIYLWIVNRMLSHSDLPDELNVLGELFLKRSLGDGISSEGLGYRWNEFQKLLPGFKSLTKEQLDAARASVTAHRDKVTSLDI